MKEEPIFEELKGDLYVPMNSEECKEHKRTHENCVGCRHHGACKEYVNRIGQFVTAELQARGELDSTFEWNKEMEP